MIDLTSYATFEMFFSLVDIVLWSVLATLLYLKSRRALAVNNQATEGPLVILLLALAVLTVIPAIGLGTPSYDMLAHYTLAFVRGFLCAGGLYLIGYEVFSIEENPRLDESYRKADKTFGGGRRERP
jgi:hypothetical protein